MAGEISLTTGELAQLLGAELTGDASVRLDRVEPIDAAGTGALTFIRDAAYAHRWAGSGASAALITRDACSSELLDATRAAPGRALLVVPDADRALLTILGAVVQRLRPAPAAGVHPSAVVHPSAKVDPAASIGPGCVVEAQARVGAHAVLMAQVYVGRQAAVGERSVLHPGVKLQDQCVIGARCVVHANVSIGADGFGFVPDAGGLSHTKIPHAGNVVIDDDVEIGAGTCIDRAKFGSTRVGAGTKIDNLVQIAHGVQIGRGCLICGCSSLAGSSSLGDGSIMGGGSALADNVKVGVKARLAGYSAVSDDVPDGASIAGVPGIDARDTLRSWAIQRELARMWPSLRRVLRQAQPETKTPRA